MARRNQAAQAPHWEPAQRQHSMKVITKQKYFHANIRTPSITSSNSYPGFFCLVLWSFRRGAMRAWSRRCGSFVLATVFCFLGVVISHIRRHHGADLRFLLVILRRQSENMSPTLETNQIRRIQGCRRLSSRQCHCPLAPKLFEEARPDDVGFSRDTLEVVDVAQIQTHNMVTIRLNKEGIEGTK